MSEENQEPLPVNEQVKVLKYGTVYKTEKWWQAVALVNMFGHKKIAMYLWQMKDGKWRRKHKITINFASNWETMKRLVEEFLPELNEVKG